ncbi:MAG TPA: hypothetical protein VF541_02080 [Longimicrobium sp.]|jgi:hypothetical protein
MREHVRILGWLYVASGAVVLLLAALFGAIFGFAGLFAARGEDAAILGVLGAVIALFITLMSLPSIVLGWGLLTWKPWSRMLGVVLSVLHLPSVPVGTLLGGYGLWVLLNDDTRRVLEAGDPRLRVPAGW